jgi:hypothetical protein
MASTNSNLKKEEAEAILVAAELKYVMMERTERIFDGLI